MLNDNGALHGVVSVFEHLGGESFVHVTLQDQQTLVAKLDGERSFKPGDICQLGIREDHCHLFDSDDNRVSATANNVLSY